MNAITNLHSILPKQDTTHQNSAGSIRLTRKTLEQAKMTRRVGTVMPMQEIILLSIPTRMVSNIGYATRMANALLSPTAFSNADKKKRANFLKKPTKTDTTIRGLSGTMTAAGWEVTNEQVLTQSINLFMALPTNH